MLLSREHHVCSHYNPGTQGRRTNAGRALHLLLSWSRHHYDPPCQCVLSPQTFHKGQCVSQAGHALDFMLWVLLAWMA
eukprot:1157345-Pelagomonas_calceolata.AAC.13